MKTNKTHTTNYYNTFIEVAADIKVDCGTKPPSKGNKKTVAEMQYDLISENPYKYTSDDILFIIFTVRNDFLMPEEKLTREQFFSKGQPCFRASPLTKTYGFGIHCDNNGKIALYGMDTDEYQQFLSDSAIKKIKALKSNK